MSRVNTFIFILTFFLSLQTFAKFESASYIEEEISALEAKYARRCMAMYPNASSSISQINEKNATESVEYAKCMIDFLFLEKIQEPKNNKERMINKILTFKIEYYQKKEEEITGVFQGLAPKITINQEFFVEKSMVVKAEEPKKTFEMAKSECIQIGFKPNSLDPLEKFLFEECMEKAGFKVKNTPENSEKPVKASTAKKQYPKKNEVQVKVWESSQESPKPEEVKQVEPTPKAQEPKEETTNKKKTACKINENGVRMCKYIPS